MEHKKREGGRRILRRKEKEMIEHYKKDRDSRLLWEGERKSKGKCSRNMRDGRKVPGLFLSYWWSTFRILSFL